MCIELHHAYHESTNCPIPPIPTEKKPRESGLDLTHHARRASRNSNRKQMVSRDLRQEGSLGWSSGILLICFRGCNGHESVVRTAMKNVWASIALGFLLAASQIATAGQAVLGTPDKAGFVVPRYERSRIEKPIIEKPCTERRVARDLFQHPKAEGLTRFPQQASPQRPYRHVSNDGYNSTPYRVSPSSGYLPNPYRGVRGDSYRNDQDLLPNVARPVGNALQMRTDYKRSRYYY